MILDDFSLDGRVALVTGGARGLGRAMAEGLAEAGADVAVLGSRAEATETRAAVEALGRRCLTPVLDLMTAGATDLQALVDTVVSSLGGLDILVNNAGTIRRAPALETTEQDWDEVLHVNQRSAFFLAQAAGRHMAAQGSGSIINTASVLSFQGGVLVPAYTASKHAVAAMTKSLANELAPLGVNVNAIAPGYFATDNTEALRNDPDRSGAILARIPAGHWGDPDDLKGAVVFLASRASRYMHGSILTVDGGWLSR